ncbi:hypothetical protein RJT34_26743 [Clitoria ternatea]|uniref:Uncharacterized protein n=1 Tax=Clitoria ternatea TaxID=43366 RepID=A0AAN9FBU3_CLITE
MEGNVEVEEGGEGCTTKKRKYGSLVSFFFQILPCALLLVFPLYTSLRFNYLLFGIAQCERFIVSSARYLSKSHTPTQSILGQRLSSTHIVNPMEDPLLGTTVISQSAPNIKTKTTLCLVSTLTFLGAFNLLQTTDTRIHSAISKPRKEFVIYVGRKLLQVNDNQLSEHGVAGYWGIGTLLGWAMAFIYIGGRLPQIYLNIRRGNFEHTSQKLGLVKNWPKSTMDYRSGRMCPS